MQMAFGIYKTLHNITECNLTLNIENGVELRFYYSEILKDLFVVEFSGETTIWLCFIIGRLSKQILSRLFKIVLKNNKYGVLIII